MNEPFIPGHYKPTLRLRVLVKKYKNKKGKLVDQVNVLQQLHRNMCTGDVEWMNIPQTVVEKEI